MNLKNSHLSSDDLTRVEKIMHLWKKYSQQIIENINVNKRYLFFGTTQSGHARQDSSNSKGEARAMDSKAGKFGWRVS